MKKLFPILLFLFSINSMAALVRTELIHSDEVTGGESCVSFTTIASETVYLDTFDGNAAHIEDTTVFVSWDYDGAGEIIKWSTHGSISQRPGVLLGTGDGTIKVGLCLKNSDGLKAEQLSGSAKFKRLQ